MNKLYLNCGILFYLILCFSNCSFYRIKEEPFSSSKQINTPEQVSEIVAAIKSQTREYNIKPLDLIEISVYEEENLKKTVRVSQNGEITFPLIGTVKIEGLTVPEIEQKIAQLLDKEYLITPQVSVFIKEYHLKKVYILGAVKKPGALDFPDEEELTFMEAISLVGGFERYANVDAIKIIRTENGNEKNFNLKASEIINRGNRSKDIILKPNDIIIVPETIF